MLSDVPGGSGGGDAGSSSGPQRRLPVRVPVLVRGKHLSSTCDRLERRVRELSKLADLFSSDDR